MPDCAFCRIAKKEVNAQVIYEDDLCVAFKDLNPQAPFHALVIPRRHVTNLLGATEQDAEILGHLLLVCNGVAKGAGVAGSGFRVVTNSNADAGQSVDHIHFHVLGGRQMGWPPG